MTVLTILKSLPCTKLRHATQRAAFVTLVSALGCTFVACGDDDAGAIDELLDQGSVRLAMVVPEGADLDVVSVRFMISQEGMPLVTEVVPVISGAPIDSRLALEAAAVAEFLVALDPGVYSVTATPLNAAGSPSTQCSVATQSNVTVLAKATTDLQMVSQCGAAGTGGIDVLLEFNFHPKINDIDVDAGGFACVNQPIALQVSASDPDGDPLSYHWSLDLIPAGASPTLTLAANQATLIADKAGKYIVQSIVTDDRGGQASLSLPIDVSDDPDKCGLDTSSGETSDTDSTSDSDETTESSDTTGDTDTSPACFDMSGVWNLESCGHFSGGRCTFTQNADCTLVADCTDAGLKSNGVAHETGLTLNVGLTVCDLTLDAAMSSFTGPCVYSGMTMCTLKGAK